MKKFTMFACLALSLVFALSSFAQDAPRMSKGNGMIYGGGVNFAKAGLDTINLMSSADDPNNDPAVNTCVFPWAAGEPYYLADFEGGMDGFTMNDYSNYTVTNWNVSNFNQVDSNNLAAWCGDIAIVACSGSDTDGGYGNSWHDLLKFSKAVGNNALSSEVTVTADLQYDSETGYDFTYLSYLYEGGFYENMGTWDGFGTEAVNLSVSFAVANYVGGTDVVIYWRFRSDGAYSDADCDGPTDGACQVDNISVRIVNGTNDDTYTEDFQAITVGEFGPHWVTEFPVSIGNYGQRMDNLLGADLCSNNYTYQILFIDDGIIVPGTGSTDCINWCYGPGGKIVNTTGGMAGEAEHLHNGIESPIMDWPGAKDCNPIPFDGINLAAGVFRHEDLSSDSAGFFYTWSCRSADLDDSAGNGAQTIEAQAWLDRNFVYYGGPDYTRAGDDMTDLMNPGRDVVQVQLTCYEYGWVWGWDGADGYPAPYFDNVTVKVYPFVGPGMASREIDQAQDNFPATGTLGGYKTGADLATLSVRFDMAMNASLAQDERNDPGDSLTVDVVAIRSGAKLTGPPAIYYILDANPVFDTYRTSGLPNMGHVDAMEAVGGPQSKLIKNKWAFDLPDTGFLFPGDVLHYYIRAEDALYTDGGTVITPGSEQVSIMPIDTTGFSTSFGDPMGYNSTFVVHALPSIYSDGGTGYEHPGILFLNDFGGRGGENEWYTAFNNIGLEEGVDYDTYYVSGPSSAVGNGIGGRATSIVLTDYADILYTSGDLAMATISNGDYANDPGDDVGVLSAWLDMAGKDILISGDEVASDLAQSGEATTLFLDDYMGVSVADNDVAIHISQNTPKVVPTSGSPVPFTIAGWIAFGGCPGLNYFDSFDNSLSTGLRIAEFVDPGAVGYAYSAATLNTGVGLAASSRVISLPYDLMYVYTDPSQPANILPGRALLLWDILKYFGVPGDAGNASPATPPGITFRTSNYPNPFNPSTTIKYSMPKAGHLTLNVYNVRGQLVKTLIDGNRPAGADQTIVWDGTNNQGSSVSSGVYFYEARTGGDVKVQKMALVK